MTKIRNSKQLAFDLIGDLEFIGNLMLVICYFRFIRVRLYKPESYENRINR
jgi:hypothetical protein